MLHFLFFKQEHMQESKHIDLNKKYKKAIADLKNFHTLSGRLDAVKQYIKFEFSKTTNEFNGLATFKYFIHFDFLFNYYWVGLSDKDTMDKMLSYCDKSVAQLEKNLKKQKSKNPILISYVRTRAKTPNVEASLRVGYAQREIYSYLEKKYNLNHLVCMSKFSSPEMPDLYTKYVKSFGFNLHTGTVISNFDFIQNKFLPKYYKKNL